MDTYVEIDMNTDVDMDTVAIDNEYRCCLYRIIMWSILISIVIIESIFLYTITPISLIVPIYQIIFCNVSSICIELYILVV